ncbi:hypothetical protein [Sorangium sp. So ce362]|uniref:hypothetical protein n=1 Tax=Sorangium sp. So ce362 TaxID=3133303 RepID=UPI003F638B5C
MASEGEHPAVQALEAALAAVRRLPATPNQRALSEALAAAAGLAGKPRGASSLEVVASALRAGQQALMLVASETIDLALVEKVARAINACLRTADRIPEVDELRDRDTHLAGQPFTSTRERPRVLRPRRERFVKPEGPPAPVAIDAEDDDASSGAAPPASAEDEEDGAGEAATRAASAIGEEGATERGDPLYDDPDRMLPQKPVVWANRAVGAPAPLTAYYAEITDSCADKIAMLARHRSELASEDRAHEEMRMLELADAAAITGRDCVARTLAWWEESIESPDPWKTWAAAFLLGTLDGRDALQAITFGLERLPACAIAQGMLAAEALCVSPHPGLAALARDLAFSPHPIARAVGVDVLARLRMLTVEDLQRNLADANIPVLAAAARAAADFDRVDAEPLVPILRRWLHVPDRSIAWPAARALLLWGHRDPYAELKAGDRLTRVLGPLAAEIIVLVGDASDMARMQSILGRLPPGRDQLSALARFGHPAAWAYLLRCLESPDHAEAASAALRTLFGACVDEDDEECPAAWRSAITAKPVELGVRYRCGEPWIPRVVADECVAGHLSRYEIEKRIDELAIRAGVCARVDLRLFYPDFAPALRQWCAEAAKRSTSFRPGAW